MKPYKKVANIFFTCFWLYLPIYADVVGSDSAVSVASFYTFPQNPLLFANRVASFARMQNGFALQNSSTSCTFDSVFPVMGTINLNGGNLTLTSDLILKNGTSLIGLGTIIGNNNKFSIPSSVTAFPANTQQFSDTAIILNNYIAVQSSILFSGSCSIDGNKSSIIDFNDTGTFIIASNSTLTIKNMQLQNVNTANIVFASDTSKLVLDNCTWIQNGDYRLSTGSIKFINDVDMTGNYSFIYDSAQTSTIAQKSQWRILNGLTLSIGKKSDDAVVQPLAFTDLSSTLKIENSIFSVNSHGVQLTKGTVAAVRDFQVDVLGTSSMTGLILGDNTPQGDMVFDLYPGSSTRYTGGPVVYAITNGNGIRSSSDTARLVRSNTSVFWLPQSLALTNITLDLAASAVLNIAPGKTLTYANSVINVAQGAFILNGARYNAYTTLLSGNQSVFLVKGSLPLYTLVSSTGNAIQGNGNVGGAITLQDANAALTWGVEGALQNNITMNGGTLILENDLNCISGVQLLGTGTVKLGFNKVNFGSTDLAWGGNTYWDGSNGALKMNANIALSSRWTFSGQCTIDGCGREIALASGGEILVEAGSTLTISNITLKGISARNIRCLDGASVLVLDNVTWQQSDNYIFDQGSCRYVNNIILKGQNMRYAYQSQVASIIKSESSVTLDAGFTFSYDPGSSADLLQFADFTCSLVLKNDARLHATIQGLNLKKGSLVIRGNTFFESEKWTSNDGAVTIDNGISVGDCSASAHDCVTSIEAGMVLNIASGSFNYKNVNSSSLQMQNNISALNIFSYAVLNVYQSMNMGNSITTLSDQATLGRAPGADFYGSIATQGLAFFPNIDPCS